MFTVVLPENSRFTGIIHNFSGENNLVILLFLKPKELKSRQPVNSGGLYCDGRYVKGSKLVMHPLKISCET
jgi:hypothetical protein